MITAVICFRSSHGWWRRWSPLQRGVAADNYLPSCYVLRVPPPAQSQQQKALPAYRSWYPTGMSLKTTFSGRTSSSMPHFMPSIPGSIDLMPGQPTSVSADRISARNMAILRTTTLSPSCGLVTLCDQETVQYGPSCWLVRVYKIDVCVRVCVCYPPLISTRAQSGRRVRLSPGPVHHRESGPIG